MLTIDAEFFRPLPFPFKGGSSARFKMVGNLCFVDKRERKKMKSWLLIFFLLTSFGVSNSVAQFRLLITTDSVYYLADSKSVSFIPVKSSLDSVGVTKKATIFNVVTVPLEEIYCDLYNIPDSAAPSFILKFNHIFSWSSVHERDSLFSDFVTVEKLEFKMFYVDSLFSNQNSSFVLSHRRNLFIAYVIGKSVCLLTGGYKQDVSYPRDFTPPLSGTVGESLYNFARTYKENNKSH